MADFRKYCVRLLLFANIGFLIGSILLSGCAETPIMGAPLSHLKLMDGVYEGTYKSWPNSAVTKVTIKDNRIVNIEIVEHWAFMGKKAELPISERIIKNQSTRVDAVSGATNSSIVIMNAVQKAVEKAYQNQTGR
ncbi:MAG: FMN-binding protein [Thermodesulfobacteriota bacterium]|nr:FMN-binding protein [Thermodesulfobacteriota bacterium]